MNPYPFLESEVALHQFVRDWEAHVLPKAEWTHAAHVGVCAYYTARFDPKQALLRMREGIPTYNVAVGGQNTEDGGYHETLTCLWAQIITEFLAAYPYNAPYEAVSAAVEVFGQDRKRHVHYYSWDIVTTGAPDANG